MYLKKSQKISFYYAAEYSETSRQQLVTHRYKIGFFSSCRISELATLKLSANEMQNILKHALLTTKRSNRCAVEVVKSHVIHCLSNDCANRKVRGKRKDSKCESSKHEGSSAPSKSKGVGETIKRWRRTYRHIKINSAIRVVDT